MSLNIFVRVIFFVAAFVIIILLAVFVSLMISRDRFAYRNRKEELRGICGKAVNVSEETVFELMGIGAVANRIIVEDNHGCRIMLWDVFDDIIISEGDSGLFVVRGDTITGFERC